MGLVMAMGLVTAVRLVTMDDQGLNPESGRKNAH